MEWIMTDARNWLILALALVVGVLLLRGDTEERDPDAELKTETLIADLREAGWYVAETDPSVGVREIIDQLEGDTTRLAGLWRDAEERARVLGGEVRGLVSAHASAIATVEGLQGIVDSLSIDTGEPVSVSAELDDDPFSGRLTYWYAERSFDASLRADIELGLTVTEGADGRVLFGAVAPDPRVSVTLDRAAWTPPPPVERCTLSQSLRSGLIGGAAVAVGAALLGG